MAYSRFELTEEQGLVLEIVLASFRLVEPGVNLEGADIRVVTRNSAWQLSSL